MSGPDHSSAPNPDLLISEDGRDIVDHAAYQATGNPLFIWWAIAKFRPSEPLPPWIRHALLVHANRIARAAADRSIEPKVAADQAMSGLSLVSQGKNLVEAFRRHLDDCTIHSVYMLSTRKSGNADSIVMHLARVRKLTTRAIWGCVARARKTTPRLK